MDVVRRLLFNGQLVGYRVKVNNSLFDVSLDDLELLSHDFHLHDDPNYEINGEDIILVESGSQLVPKNASNVLELTYGLYAKFQGYKRLEDTDPDLKRMYNKYNDLCFNGELPTLVAVQWSTRMTSGAGICEYKRGRTPGGYDFTIKLSVPYHNRYPTEVVDTLVHEMIHVLLPREGHGRGFHRVKDALNAKFGFNLAVYSSGRASYKYLYLCSNCEQRYERNKKINVNISTCGKRSCRSSLYLAEDLTEEEFDVDMDWTAEIEI